MKNSSLLRFLNTLVEKKLDKAKVKSKNTKLIKEIKTSEIQLGKLSW